MKKPLNLILAILILIIGGFIGFYISQEYFPKFDYGYTKEGGNKIVTRIKKPIQPETYELTKMLKVPEGMTIEEFKKNKMIAEVSVVVEEMPNKDSKYLKKGTVSINVPGYSSWEVWSDEGSVGAGDQAPCPLDYLTLGTAFCLASHLRLATEALGLNPGNMKVELRSYYGQYGDFGKEGTYGTTENIKTHILINSDLPQNQLLKMIRIAQNNCYATEGFKNSTEMETKIFINGTEVK
jgi:uncharacterized OsmC-like protein